MFTKLIYAFVLSFCILNLGGAIYSVDIHPDGTKIATCGQGGEGGSGLVIIWNVKPVINEKASQEASCSRLLSRILHQSNLGNFHLTLSSRNLVRIV